MAGNHKVQNGNIPRDSWGARLASSDSSSAVHPNQEQHHRRMTFGEEFIALPKRHGGGVEAVVGPDTGN
jgi:hypothetical protein